MDMICEQVLRKLYEKALQTSDGFLFSADIGVTSGERARIRQYLERHGYIANSVPTGRDKLQCQVTEKTMNYFSEK